MSCPRCSPLKGDNIIPSTSNSCDTHFKISYIEVYKLEDEVMPLSRINLSTHFQKATEFW